MISFVKKCQTINQYHTKNWDTEHSYKYLFKYDDCFIEAGYFIHYKDNKEVKKVIELSSSYGCPFKCKHCASSCINDFKILPSEIIMAVLEYIIDDNHIKKTDKLIVPITGIGDLYWTVKEVVKFINNSSLKYPNIVYDISTIMLNERILDELKLLNDKSKIRYFQITYIYYNHKINDIINLYNEKYEFEKIVNLINNSDFNNYRINYILIKDYNNNEIEYNKFIEFINPIKNKVSIRISRFNQTKSSIDNKIKCGTINDMKKLSKLLNAKQIKNYIFYSNKNDNMNCGQLIYSVEREKIG